MPNHTPGRPGPWLLLLLAAVLAGSVGATCSGGGGDSGKPEDAVRNLYESIAKWDTDGVVKLACPETRDEIKSGLQQLSDLPAGLKLPNLKLRDMRYVVVSQTATSATVSVTGRTEGAPLGDQIDETHTLRKDGSRWCVAE